jgi:hypothetical protein
LRRDPLILLFWMALVDRDSVDQELARIDNADMVKNLHGFAGDFEHLCNACHRSGQDELAQQMQWELEAWRIFPDTAHNFVDFTTYSPMLAYEDGTVWPDPTQFTEKQWAYLAERMENSQNLFIRAHYGDLLWFFRKDYAAAVVAIEAFVQGERVWWDANAAGHIESGPNWITALVRPLEMARQLNHVDLLSIVRTRILERLTYITTLEYCDGLYLSLVDCIAARIKRFDHQDQQSIIEQLDTYAKRLHHSTPYWSGELFDALIAISRIQGNRDLEKRFHRDRAGSFVAQAESTQPESSLIAADLIGAAVSSLEKVGRKQNVSDIERLQRRRVEILSNSESQFSPISVEFSLDLSNVDQFVDRFKNTGSPLVLVPSVFLMCVLPSDEDLRGDIERLKQEAPLQFLFPHQTISDDGLLEGEATEEGEIFEWNYWNHSAQQLRISSYLVGRAISQLGESSWNLANATAILRNSPVVDPSRLESLEAALERYFAADYRTAIPLMTLEFEPIVRGVVQKLGLSTVTQNSNKNPKLQRSKYLNECLDVPEVRKQLGDRWVRATRTLLTQGGGLKLRHGIAHGRPVQHLLNQPIADLLGVLLLWVGNYREV